MKGDPAFQALCDAHAGDTGFDATRNEVKRVTAELERNVDGHSHREQVRFALETLNTFKQASDGMILCEIVRARYLRHWSPELREYFEWAAERVRWEDYFLSFTSYNPTQDINAVNTRYLYLIRDQIPLTWQERQRDRTANLLASMLDNVLRNAQLKGFFWERHEGDSSVVKQKLKGKAQQSLAFVQVLQSAMFVKEPPPNFCHFEYELAVTDTSRVLVFVRAEPSDNFIARVNVDVALHGWYDDVAERDPFELTPTLTWARATIEANLAGIQARVVERVKEARRLLFEEVP